MRPDRADRRWGKQRTRREKRLKGTGMENIPRGAQVEVTRVGGNVPPLEENEYLPGFSPERVHLLFQEVYGDFPHHNNRAHLDRGIMDDTVWQRHWRRLAAQSSSWYAIPSGAVGHLFTEILAA